MSDNSTNSDYEAAVEQENLPFDDHHEAESDNNTNSDEDAASDNDIGSDEEKVINHLSNDFIVLSATSFNKNSCNSFQRPTLQRT